MSKHQLQRHCEICGNPLSASAQYCGYCGSRVSINPQYSPISYCPNCGMKLNDPKRFCSHCGYQINTHYSTRTLFMGSRGSGSRQLASLEKLGFGLIAFAVIEFFIILLVNIVILGPAFYAISQIPFPSYEFSLFIPIEVPLFTIEGISFLIYFLIEIIAIVGSFYWLFRKYGRQLINILRHPFVNNENFAKISNNSLILISQLFFALMFFNILYIISIFAFGSTPTTPDLGGGTDWELLFLLANAAVYEELIIRILLIGIPLLIIRGIQQRNISKNNLIKYLGGGNIDIGKVELFFILFSSVIFGLAHVAGWGWWKFGQATLGGIILGYLFIRVGLPGSIALHFCIDYLSVFLLIFDISNLALSSTAGLIIGLVLLTLVTWFVASIYYFSIYIKNILNILKKRIKPDDLQI